MRTRSSTIDTIEYNNKTMNRNTQFDPLMEISPDQNEDGYHYVVERAQNGSIRVHLADPEKWGDDEVRRHTHVDGTVSPHPDVFKHAIVEDEVVVDADDVTTYLINAE